MEWAIANWNILLPVVGALLDLFLGGMKNQSVPWKSIILGMLTSIGQSAKAVNDR